MPYKVSAAGISDIGLVRENNEDVWAEIPDRNFFILADGMGGHLAGEVASREAVEKLVGLIKNDLGRQMDQATLEEAMHLLAAAINEVNTYVYRMGKKSAELRGMGTTLCCIYVHPQGVIYAHVGDSRIYRLRAGKLAQITKDHSLLSELVELGEISERQAGEFAYKNIITKAIGTESSVDPSIYKSDILDGDLYLMCSDGLSDLLSLKQIEDVLNQTSAPSITLQNLVAIAKEKGGHDNITVVIATIHESSRTAQHLSG